MAPRLRSLLRKVEISQEPDVVGNAAMNHDTRPLEPERRTYGPWQFVGLWIITGSFNIGGWTTGSSLIGLGLNVWQTMLCVIVGNILVGFICLGTGMPGARWHIGFSILQKSSWGMYGAYFPIINRIMLSFIWFSTQVYWGGQCTRTFITAIWPSFRNLNAPLANGTMTTGDFIAFIIFWLLCLPGIWIKPEKYKIPFAVTAVLVIPTVFIILIWCVVTAHGGGALLENVSAVAGVPQAEGTRLGWMLVLGIITNIGSISTHIFSQSDFTRFARKPRDQVLSQLIMVPLGTIVVALIGVICTSCAASLFPETDKLLWQPYALFDALQVHYHDSHGSRAAVAFASISFTLAQFGIAIAENAISNGIDLSAVAPRWFNIHRGAYLTACLAFVMQPWQLMNGTSNFLSVMGGYAVFLGPFTGVMFADYYIIRKRLLKLSDLYEESERSIYWYTHGINWRAPVAWVMGVWPILPGFVQWIRDPAVEMPGWSKAYYFSWVLGCAISMAVYVGLTYAFPIQGVGIVDDEDVFGTFDKVEFFDGQEVRPDIEDLAGSDIKMQAFTTKTAEA